MARRAAQASMEHLRLALVWTVARRRKAGRLWNAEESELERTDVPELLQIGGRRLDR